MRMAQMPLSVLATRMAPSEQAPMAKRITAPLPPARNAPGVMPSKPGVAAYRRPLELKPAAYKVSVTFASPCKPALRRSPRRAAAYAFGVMPVCALKTRWK
ncbi:hypothetical protein D3C80_1919570 [compost metagenome]